MIQTTLTVNIFGCDYFKYFYLLISYYCIIDFDKLISYTLVHSTRRTNHFHNIFQNMLLNHSHIYSCFFFFIIIIHFILLHRSFFRSTSIQNFILKHLFIPTYFSIFCIILNKYYQLFGTYSCD